jgi:hypothetical protein
VQATSSTFRFALRHRAKLRFLQLKFRVSRPVNVAHCESPWHFTVRDHMGHMGHMGQIGQILASLHKVRVRSRE